jgi:hypothetical protein
VRVLHVGLIVPISEKALSACCSNLGVIFGLLLVLLLVEVDQVDPVLQSHRISLHSYDPNMEEILTTMISKIATA